MSWYHRLLNVVRPDRVAADIDRELAFHVAEAEDELRAAGYSPEAAAREARRRFGNYGLQKERTRDVDVLPWLESLLSDLRYAARALRASPAFAVVAILSLALGIGANTAIFSLINAVMLRPLPVHDPHELVQVASLERNAEPHDRSGVTVTNPLWEALRDRQDAFSGVFAVGETRFDVSAGSEIRSLEVQLVSGGAFSTLGVQAALGRIITTADDVRGCPPIAVLSHGYWQREYGADPAVLGRTLSLNQKPVQIVGVLQPGFQGVTVGQNMNVFAPICAIEAIRGTRNQLDSRSAWWLRVVGRPKPGLSTEEVRARLSAIAPPVYSSTVPQRWARVEQQAYEQRILGTSPAPNGISYMRGYHKALFVLMGMVAVVLLIACANVANLLVARATMRQGEVAIRLALGASRFRLLRQLVTESMLLSFLGALAGVLFARWSSQGLVSLISTRNDIVSLDLSIDLRVFLFTVAVAAVTGLLFGVAPAWRARHVSPHSALKSGGRGLVRGSSRFQLGKVLVVAQVALSLVLVAGAGLLVSTFWTLSTMDPGFRRADVLIATLDLRRARVTAEQFEALYQRIRTRLEELPGARSVSASQMTPVGGNYWNELLQVEGFAPRQPEDALAYFNQVTDGYFETLGMQLLAGRDFNDGDAKSGERVALVNETMARRFFGQANPLGRSFQVKVGDENGPPIRIVGVVSDAKVVQLREENLASVYLPLLQRESPSATQTFLLRAGSVAALPPAIRAAAGEFDPNIGLEFTSLADQLGDSIRQERLLASLSGFFAGVALLLALVGMYGVMSYHVMQRRREIGVRMAFGAERTAVLRMIFTQVGGMLAAGVGIGLVATFALSRLIASFLYGVVPTEPRVLGAAVLLLGLVAVAAGLLPARRAARLDPLIALREE